MVKKLKKRPRTERITRKLDAAPTFENKSRLGWFNSQIGGESYFFLAVCVIAQLATVLITWPTWQVRTQPPNLPWFQSTPQFSCGILLVISLVLVLISPRKCGLAFHLVILTLAISMDQFRCQPQVLSIAFLMAACVWKPVRRVCVWFLVSMWLWAGIHKYVSPDWFMQVSYQLLSGTRVDAKRFHFAFAVIVMVGELLLAVAAWRKPKLAAAGCVALHFGIVAFLVVIDWNRSVLPWNLCTAVVGAWLLWNAETVGATPGQRRLAIPDSWCEKTAIIALLIVPVGMYFGVVRHCFAHALYSGNLPMGLVTHRDGIEPLEVWDELQFPFPNVPKAYRDYFLLTGAVGDKLHIRDPGGISSRYFRLASIGRLQEITVDDFFSGRDGSVEGIALDDPRKIYLLEMSNATLLKRSRAEMIYAVKFDPGRFDATLLAHLRGLPNLEQIQLAACDVEDNDLELLSGYRKLMGLGLDGTAITNAGLKQLHDLPSLIVLEHEGTAITREGLDLLGIPQ